MTEKGSEGRGLRERPPKKRIDEILENRNWAIQHMHMRYEARRDYLQLCAEIEHLRSEAQQTPHAAGGELRKAAERLLEEIHTHHTLYGWDRFSSDIERVARAALAAQTSPAAGEGRDGFEECAVMLEGIGKRLEESTPPDFAGAMNMRELAKACRWRRAAEHPQPAPEGEKS